MPIKHNIIQLSNYRASGGGSAVPVLAVSVFLKVKNKIPFCKKQVIKQKPSIILVRLMLY